MSAANIVMTAQLSPPRTEIQVTFTNVDTTPVLLNVGFLAGIHSVCACKLLILGAGLKSKTLSNLDEPGAIGGRTDPWVVVLPSRAEYTLKFPTNRLMLDRDGITLADIQRKTWTVIVKLEGKQALDEAPGGKKIPYHITDIPFWRGKLTAEIVNRN